MTYRYIAGVFVAIRDGFIVSAVGNPGRWIANW